VRHSDQALDVRQRILVEKLLQWHFDDVRHGMSPLLMLSLGSRYSVI
jgi:hypothetical protein